ncbi:hypothetical protein [Saccharopolyspora thermophila]|uniref:Uncharacterized protein n=1 Tax=Saccharopolyspora thermophila TaxID=89367 RepID=A0ABP3MRJ8_9PSEU|nr:hypothetical protein [Saccharopolyspora subtropica]
MLAIMAQPGPPPDFPTAARRHYQNALLLRKEQRLPNADHVAGMAAECGLKAILIGYLDGFVNKKNNKPDHPVHPSGKPGPSYGHLPTLWEEICLVASGRNANAFYLAMTQKNPFHR